MPTVSPDMSFAVTPVRRTATTAIQGNTDQSNDSNTAGRRWMPRPIQLNESGFPILATGHGLNNIWGGHADLQAPFAPFLAADNVVQPGNSDLGSVSNQDPTTAPGRAQQTNMQTASLPPPAVNSHANATELLTSVQRSASNIQTDLAALLGRLSQLSNQMSQLQANSKCCICLEASHNAQLLPCMHNKFCKECLERHLQRNRRCPVCRTLVSGMLSTFG